MANEYGWGEAREASSEDVEALACSFYVHEVARRGPPRSFFV